MGGAQIALAHERDMWDGILPDGFTSGQNPISYYQLESVLLEYPQILEAGVVARHDENYQCQILSVYLALQEQPTNEEAHQRFVEEVIDYVQSHFELRCPIDVKIKDKLPMTRSGKILRTVLAKLN
ncbi:MAG: acetyl-CoA synthetase [Desulfitobacterium sp.]|nr:acetyl-CoA synthetase [Desulfitobacterium sp.]